MSHLKVIQMPEHDVRNIARGLRELADDIEAGHLGEAINLAWAVDCGEQRPPNSPRIVCGLLGKASDPGGTGHLLFCCAARRMETAALEYADET